MLERPREWLGLPLWVHATALTLTLASVAATRCAVYTGGNHPLQIALLQRLQQPTLYPHDPFADTLSAYASPFWWAAALGCRFFGLDATLLLILVLSRLFSIYAGAYLARTLAPSAPLAVVAAMCWMALVPEPPLGYGTIVSRYPEQTGLAVALFLLALVQLWNGHPARCAVCFGLGWDCNSMYGVYAVTYLGALVLADPALRARWRSDLLCAPLAGLTALPALVLGLRLYAPSTVDSELWAQVAIHRFEHHFTPSTWAPTEWGLFVLLAVVAGGVFLRIRTMHRRRATLGLTFLLVAVGWIVFAFVAVAARRPGLLVLHAGRGPDLWYPVAIVALLGLAAERLHTPGAARTGWLPALLLATFAFALHDYHLLTFAPSKLGAYLLPLALLVSLIPPAAHWFLATGNQRRVAALLIAPTLICFGGQVFARHRETDSLYLTLFDIPKPALRELGAWARAHTPPDAVFLVDPVPDELRLILERPVFTTYKDGSAMLWKRDFVQTWVERMEALGVDVRDLRATDAAPVLTAAYAALGRDQVLALARAYGVRYWIVPPDHDPAGFEPAFRNAAFQVLSVP